MRGYYGAIFRPLSSLRGVILILIKAWLNGYYGVILILILSSLGAIMGLYLGLANPGRGVILILIKAYIYDYSRGYYGAILAIIWLEKGYLGYKGLIFSFFQVLEFFLIFPV